MRSHHERYDGKGYPDSLAGKKIPLEAHIMAVSDCFDAMTSNRPYRSAMNREDALLEIEANKGTQFNPEIVEIFLDIISFMPDDLYNLISNGRGGPTVLVD